MMVLITYDVNTEGVEGKRRLRRVAKACVNRGQRVQHSVFECNLTPAMYVELKAQLENIIDGTKDSIRFYNLGKSWSQKVETIGVDETYNPEKDVFIF